MTDSNKENLRLAIGIGPDDIVLPQEPDEERVFTSALGRDIPESELDRLAQTGQFTYIDACRMRGVNPDDLFDEKKSRSKKLAEPLACEIGKRATYLMEAAYYYVKSDQSDKKMRELIKVDAESDEIDKEATNEQQFRFAGDAAIRKLIMEKQLIKAGFDPHSVRRYARNFQQEFYDLFTSEKPEDQEHLCELVAIWKAQKESIEEKNRNNLKASLEKQLK